MQKVALVNSTTHTLKKPRIRDRTDIRPGNGAGLFLQVPRSRACTGPCSQQCQTLIRTLCWTGLAWPGLDRHRPLTLLTVSANIRHLLSSVIPHRNHLQFFFNINTDFAVSHSISFLINCFVLLF